MTQNTQTTAERMLALIANNQQTIKTGGVKLIDHSRAANLIAAEIDGLRRELAEARAGRERVLSWFAWLIGGWNATQGEHTGRLRFDGVDYDNDEAIARHILSAVRADDQKKLAEARAELNAWRVMFPVNTPAEIAAKLMRGG